MIIPQNMLRIFLVAVIPGAGGAVQRIVFGTGRISARHFRKGLGGFFRPGADPMLFQIGKIYVGAEIVALEGKLDPSGIRGAFYPGPLHGVFQLLNSTFNRIGRVADPVGNLRVFGILGPL